MRRAVAYRPEVESDVRESFVWYETQRAGLGWEFTLCIEQAIERIRNNPDLFPSVTRRVRRAPVRRFPYGIFFSTTREIIIVIAVMHSSRDPKSWKSRSFEDR